VNGYWFYLLISCKYLSCDVILDGLNIVLTLLLYLLHVDGGVIILFQAFDLHTFAHGHSLIS
jgi:hypothetical protein